MPNNKNQNDLPCFETITPLNSHADCLLETWSLASSPANHFNTPDDIPDDYRWTESVVPGTIHSTRDRPDNNKPGISHGRSSSFDHLDWWYQCQFTASKTDNTECLHFLQFDGLACLAEVWLNGQCILNNDNMFVGHKTDISDHIKATNRLFIVFRSLEHALKEKRPRPRWKTNLVDNQQLRWFRTTLLGHIPGWAGYTSAIGPWRGIYLKQTDAPTLERFHIKTELKDNQGIIKIEAYLHNLYSKKIEQARLVINDREYPLDIEIKTQHCSIKSTVTIKTPPLWWPHTHGTPELTNYKLQLDIDNKPFCIKSGQLGFKKIDFTDDDAVGFRINDIAVFCRGACWTNNDIKDLVGDPEKLQQSLELAKSAGINMLRIGGTMVYESDLFYQLCDQMGILVWQDFMFANMDYPIDNDEFASSVCREIDYQLLRLHSHACIALYCGNSEVEQQAAMFGISEEIWQNDLFYKILPEACRHHHPSIPYIPSSPCLGALPFHINTGVSHYFGVGAYKKTLQDPSLLQVKFTSECLGFSNIPCQATLVDTFDKPAPAVHHPQWKNAVPRDNTAGWDFEDIRDHYFKSLFKLDPIELRYSDNERYIALSQIVSGELMQSVYGLWRSELSQCQGGLIWFFKDFIPGAGWGIIDSLNRPKPVYYYLKRIWREQVIVLNDRQLDGLNISVINESAKQLNGSIELCILSNSHTEVARAEQAFTLAPYSNSSIAADRVLGRFYDTNYAYRFGPAKHDVVIAKLKNEQSYVIGEAFYFPNGLNLNMQPNANIQTELSKEGDHLILQIQSDCFLQAVQLEIRDYEALDNFFHLSPNNPKTIRLRRVAESGKSFKGSLKSLNIPNTVRLQL